MEVVANVEGGIGLLVASSLLGEHIGLVEVLVL